MHYGEGGLSRRSDANTRAAGGAICSIPDRQSSASPLGLAMGPSVYVAHRTPFTTRLSRRFPAARPGRGRPVKRVEARHPRRFTRRNDGLSERRITSTRFRGTEAEDRQTCEGLHLREKRGGTSSDAKRPRAVPER